jgi:hypothetical protein
MHVVKYSLCLLALTLSVPAMAYEEPPFSTVAVIGGIEYRAYEPYLVAETVVAGPVERDKAASIAFRRLFDYISGANTVQTKIEMTTPVRQEAISAKAGTKIDMTTPVRQEKADDGWIVSFIVPSEFDQTTVPQPTNPAVYLREIPGERVAVVRYSGRWTDSNIDQHRSALLAGLAAADIRPAGKVVTAFYNAPFTLPPLRRNEVMVAIDEFPSGSI